MGIDPAPPGQKITAPCPVFGPCLVVKRLDGSRCHLVRTEVNLGPGDVVLDGVTSAPPERDTAPSFRPASIVAKRLDGWMKTTLVRKYRPRPVPHCVRRGPAKWAQQPPLFSAHVCCFHGRPSQLLLTSCSHGRSIVKRFSLCYIPDCFLSLLFSVSPSGCPRCSCALFYGRPME